MRSFDDLAENEILALAIAAEEEDGRIFADFAHGLSGDFPDSAEVFAGMAEEEDGHRRILIDLYVAKYGQHIPLVRRRTTSRPSGRVCQTGRRSMKPRTSRRRTSGMCWPYLAT